MATMMAIVNAVVVALRVAIDIKRKQSLLVDGMIMELGQMLGF